MAKSPKSTQELLDAFNAITSEISRTVLPLSPSHLHKTPGPDSWSVRQLLDHLVRSVQPVVKVMGTPRRVLLRTFGAPQVVSRDFDVIQAVYRSELAGGAVAAGPFLPDAAVPDDDLLRQWETVCEEFIEELSEWTEADLDAYQVPHPLIGMLTMREMVMFSVYHCRHHFAEIIMILHS